MAEILGVKKQYLKLMQKMDIESDHLGVMQEYSKANLPVTAESFSRIIELYGRYDAQKAVQMTKYASLGRIENYCRKRVDTKNQYRSIFQTWFDYIGFCEKLGYDLTNDFVVFPRHLKKAHDVMNRRLETKKRAARAKKLREATKNLADYLTGLQKKYGFEDDAYVIVAPTDFNEIVKEGHILRHCVGSYAENAADQKTIILFVRSKSDIDAPFYTMEIQGEEVRQCRGMKNCNMTESVQKFVDSFKQKVLALYKKAA